MLSIYNFLKVKLCYRTYWKQWLAFLTLCFLVFACSDDEGNPCLYQPTLTTLEATEINDFNVTLNGVVSIVSENCDNPNNTEQGFVYSTSIQPTINDNKVNVNGTEISTTLENLEPDTTYYARVFLTNAFGDFYGNEISFTTSDLSPVYLAENGVTVKAKDWAEVGMSGEINGVIYTIVDGPMLAEMIANNEDVSTVCTSLIIDMSGMFGSSNLNQNISSWDVSNVTTMSGMFHYSQFNGDISNWDVSSVTDFSMMFMESNFNESIGDWNVSSATNMSNMFTNSPFNQPIGNWDVSSVENISYMFGHTPFDQPIGDWDVSNVKYMYLVFRDAQFFNQDISSWNVSSVEYMMEMFNQAEHFNQDLSMWQVESVYVCVMFACETPNWNLPKPNFNNCGDIGCN